MRFSTLFIFSIIVLLLSACGSDRDVDGAAENDETPVSIPHKIDYPEIKLYQKFGFMSNPLYLEEVSFGDNSQYFDFNDADMKLRVKEVLTNFYFDELKGDKEETSFKLKDLYVGTIRYHNRINEMYLIILRFPDGKLTCKLIFENVDPSTNASVLDFPIDDMYEYQDGNFVRSELLNKLDIQEPIVVFVTRKKLGAATAVKLTRLGRNGTANALETTVLAIESTHVDTLSHERKSLETVVE